MLVSFFLFFFFVSIERAVLYPVLKERVLSCIKHQGGVGCTPGFVPSLVLPVHVCVLPSLAVVTVKKSAGGAAPEPGEGQRAWEDHICFSAALGVSRNCEE